MSAEFDPEQHEAEVAERYEQLSRYEVFNSLVDMALDGVITMPQALKEYREQFNATRAVQSPQT